MQLESSLVPAATFHAFSFDLADLAYDQLEPVKSPKAHLSVWMPITPKTCPLFHAYPQAELLLGVLTGS